VVIQSDFSFTVSDFNGFKAGLFAVMGFFAVFRVVFKGYMYYDCKNKSPKVVQNLRG
jgi:hypothetical protein